MLTHLLRSNPCSSPHPLTKSLLQGFRMSLLSKTSGHPLTFDGQCSGPVSLVDTKMAKVVTIHSINPHIRRMENRWSDSLLTRKAPEMDGNLKQGSLKSFPGLMEASMDDLQAIGHTPNTFLRQVMALTTLPDLLNSPEFPEDAKVRAKRILDGCRGKSIGSYTDGCGIEVIREDVADYIKERDGGVASSKDDIVITPGAAGAIAYTLSLLASEKDHPHQSGIMIPFPGHPLYSDIILSLNSYPIPYYLDEDSGWDIGTEELERALNAVRDHCNPRALVVINPGYPTGHVMSEKTIENVIRFAEKEKLILLADEVYQQIVFGEDVTFHSFKKVLCGMGDPYEDMQLISFMSASKSIASECGFRGGYLEGYNLGPDVLRECVKQATACAPVPGQLALDVILKPPLPGEPSYEQFRQEAGSLLSNLRAQAPLICQAFHSVDGVTCVQPSGATFAFPRIHLPLKAVQEAREKGLSPDDMYCLCLLNETGICVRPGSGFGQREGHFHFRLSMMQSMVHMEVLLRKFKEFHRKFLSTYL